MSYFDAITLLHFTIANRNILISYIFSYVSDNLVLIWIKYLVTSQFQRGMSFYLFLHSWNSHIRWPTHACMLAQSLLSLWDSMDFTSPSGSSVLQARTGKCAVVLSSSKGSSWPMDWTLVSCIGRWILLPLCHLRRLTHTWAHEASLVLLLQRYKIFLTWLFLTVSLFLLRFLIVFLQKKCYWGDNLKCLN